MWIFLLFTAFAGYKMGLGFRVKAYLQHYKYRKWVKQSVAKNDYFRNSLTFHMLCNRIEYNDKIWININVNNET